MSNPFGNSDVENGNNGDFTIDDDDLDNVDIEGADIHDQLPTPEEYKAKMFGGTAPFAQFSPSKEAAELSEAGSVYGDDRSVAMHDQLPNVDEYKTTSQLQREKGYRAGLYTFLILLLLTIIITGVTVPLVLRSDEQRSSSVNANASSNGSGSGGNSGVPGPAPTGPSPPDGGTRYQQAIDYLVAIGVSTRTILEQDTGSPQYKAAFWIAYVDEYQIQIPSSVGGGSDNELPIHTRFTERYALAVFYYSTGGESWKYSMRFLQPIDHCEWYQDFITTSGQILRLGVSECKDVGIGFEEKLVHSLEMPNNGLAGDLPSEIQLLHRLTKLALSFNANLTSQKSLDGVHMLVYLTDLELHYCSLVGRIPDWFGNLRALTNLSLGNNALDGPLPDSFFKLTNLVLLGLDDNGFTGPIEPFAAFTQLDSLYLEDNVFTGELTESLIRSWGKMVELDLSTNKLDGPLPPNLWSITSLQVMDLNGNNFVGPIPEITTLHDNLQFLSLYNNRLDWRIPTTINNLKNLAHLDLSINNLELPYPSTMSQLSLLRYLFTGENRFVDHPIPQFLAQLTNLRELSMKESSLTGTIPTFLGNLSRLQVLDLDRNKLEGQIPEELGQLTAIQTLMLNRNNLNGTIPESFSALSALDVLLLDGNDIGSTADVICADDSRKKITHFIADCARPNPEIVCSCCTLCCSDSNTTCNSFDWRINLDPIWEYGFRRVVYKFSQNVLPPAGG
ncbi:RHS repeat-associated core domain containing protein [Nitzschia inconspicua]|uniref:RHS repeat-associated core domain containing protein n=1 Tax=Nitzschia inconspicua TaxID=303405 RepID=A0A9K3PL84_9STRA|nr:RHS repeat-associated core domain containing protein [Nitzschia inconspicua]